MTKRIYLCYNTSMKNKTIKNLIAASAFVMLFVASQHAFAYIPGVWEPADRISTSDQTNDINNSSDSSYDSNAAAISASLNGTGDSVASSTSKSSSTKKVATKSSTSTKSSSVNNSSSSSNGSVVNSDGVVLQPVSTSNLQASSGGLANGFMPNTFFQWLFVFLLICIVVIIFRLIVRSGENHGHAGAH